MYAYTQLCVVLAVLYCVYSCPVIHINRETGPDSQGGFPTITTIIQSDQVKDIFENATDLLLDNQEERFRKFLAVNDVPALPTDCQDIRALGHSRSDVYTIFPGRSSAGFRVFCDMDTGTGGWTVIQRRIDGSEDFARDWNGYLTGFGRPEHEYWLGNQQIYLLTTSAWYEIRIDMVNQEGEKKHVTYDIFSISDAESGFKLFIDGYHGDIDDTNGFINHKGMKFSTHDRDQDSYAHNCAKTYHGGWWYQKCHYVSPNGKYGGTNSEGVHWHPWGGHGTSLQGIEMKIRRYE